MVRAWKVNDPVWVKKNTAYDYIGPGKIIQTHDRERNVNGLLYVIGIPIEHDNHTMLLLTEDEFKYNVYGK